MALYTFRYARVYPGTLNWSNNSCSVDDSVLGGMSATDKLWAIMSAAWSSPPSQWIGRHRYNMVDAVVISNGATAMLVDKSSDAHYLMEFTGDGLSDQGPW